MECYIESYWLFFWYCHLVDRCMNGFYVCINRATIEVTEFQSHLDIVIEDLSLGWSRPQSYQHVTCAKVDLSNPLGTVGFSRVRVSRLSAFIPQERNHQPSERQIRSITPKALPSVDMN